ncbi:FAS1-like dehydratase domain-containing protein [Dactylosporangium salmoneum]|uniref:MaoC family dehydratase N-terminal domain-containing protein n=1 Tax=Dactylosporangium salmoneum TaxID=53361 RepID=A0ABN3H8F2_9ACTN
MSVTSEVFSSIDVITDEEIERVRQMIGVPLRIKQFNAEATLDTIRHFAEGAGDENPLWVDEAYAADGPHGGIVGAPTFPYSIFAAGVSPGFPGLQVFFGTGTWDLRRPIHRGERVEASSMLTDMYEKSGRTVDRMVVQVSDTTYRVGGEIAAVYTSKALRVPRATTGQGLKYVARESYRYSAEEFDEIERLTLGRTRRGAERRLFAEVNVGDQIPVLAKGPLDLTTIIAFYAGALPFGYAPCDTQWRNRHLARNAPDRLPNARDAGWIAETTWPGMGHYKSEVAQAVGMPGVYDNGWMRTSWMSQAVTDWMGDHAFLDTFEAKLIRPNLMHDTTFFRGEVTGKEPIGGRGLVHLTLTGTNQLGDTTCTGTATVALPLHDHDTPALGRAHTAEDR